MARSFGLALLVLALTACRGSHVAASAPYSLEHVRQVFAAHRLSSTLPHTVALGFSCTNLAGYRAILDGGSQWHGILFKDEQSATRLDRCMAARSLGRAYLHLRRRNLVIVAKTDLRRRIRVALAAL